MAGRTGARGRGARQHVGGVQAGGQPAELRDGQVVELVVHQRVEVFGVERGELRLRDRLQPRRGQDLKRRGGDPGELPARDVGHLGRVQVRQHRGDLRRQQAAQLLRCEVRGHAADGPAALRQQLLGVQPREVPRDELDERERRGLRGGEVLHASRDRGELRPRPERDPRRRERGELRPAHHLDLRGGELLHLGRRELSQLAHRRLRDIGDREGPEVRHGRQVVRAGGRVRGGSGLLLAERRAVGGGQPVEAVLGELVEQVRRQPARLRRQERGEARLGQLVELGDGQRRQLRGCEPLQLLVAEGGEARRCELSDLHRRHRPELRRRQLRRRERADLGGGEVADLVAGQRRERGLDAQGVEAGDRKLWELGGWEGAHVLGLQQGHQPGRHRRNVRARELAQLRR